MASPSHTERTYEVFLSFRGTDGRNNIVSHLNNALSKAGIHTYIDSERLEKGERISEGLMNAIEDSHSALIIFSEKYASSSWCLKEVAKIMECKETIGLHVLPVFYKVDPREVRRGRTSYKEAFNYHKEKCEKGEAADFNLEDVKKWEKALYDAGSLSGWEYSNGVITESKNGTPIQSGSNEFKNEAELVNFIVKKISILLTRIPCHVAKYQVGMVSRVNDLISKLRMRSQNEVQDKCFAIGLWAMGGMGKTTLAVALYNSISEKFDDSALLNISSDSKNLESLQEKLLFALTREDIKVTNWLLGIKLIEKRLGRKRVLVILDGVDTMDQIKALVGECNCFGDGSRIIVTARDQGVLSTMEDTFIDTYEVKALKSTEARELFKTLASGNGQKGIEEGLVGRALQCTGGHPLALKKLGSAVHRNSEKAWNTEEITSAISSDQTINVMFEESYSELDIIQREIFLHIACFFNGWSRKYVEGVLNSCYYGKPSVVNTVDDLIQRSLIRDENGSLQLHPLIELMGKKLVDKEGLFNPMRYSRLWRHDDVHRVLSRKKGSDAVIAIVLAPTKPGEISIGSNPFAKLTKLKFLIMINVKTSFPGPINLPDELRWFEWPECPAPSLKFTSTPSDLAVLAVRKNLLSKNRGEP